MLPQENRFKGRILIAESAITEPARAIPQAGRGSEPWIEDVGLGACRVRESAVVTRRVNAIRRQWIWRVFTAFLCFSSDGQADELSDIEKLGRVTVAHAIRAGRFEIRAACRAASRRRLNVPKKPSQKKSFRGPRAAGFLTRLAPWERV